MSGYPGYGGGYGQPQPYPQQYPPQNYYPYVPVTGRLASLKNSRT